MPNKELKTNIRGLSIVCSDDGVWLCTKSNSKKSLMLNLSNLAKEQGEIRGSALFEWCKQTAEDVLKNRYFRMTSINNIENIMTLKPLPKLPKKRKKPYDGSSNCERHGHLPIDQR